MTGANLRVDDERWRKYAKAIKDGHSQRTSAKMAGISHSTVMRQYRTPTSRLNRVLGEAGFESAGVLNLDKIKGDAERSINDFGYFRQRYFARSTSHWAEEAAYKMLALAESPNKEYVVVNQPPGVGKALALDTPIATPNGWTTQGEIQVGDELFDENGNICRVTAKSEIFYNRRCYEVKTDDGASVIADENHEWSVRLHGTGQYKAIAKPDYVGKTGPKPSKDGRQIHTTEFLAKSRSKKAQLQLAQSLDLPDASLPIDPYVLGVWLGDGNSDGARITTHPDDIEILTRVASTGYTVERKGYMRYAITGSDKWKRNGLHSDLRKANLLNNKHIPFEYFRASHRQRLALLQGLVDTDGSVNENGLIEFCNTNPNLAFGVQELVHSLGVKANISESRATLNGKDCGPKWRVVFYIQDGAYLERKRERTRNGVRTPSRYLIVTETSSVPTQCIQVDSPSHLYLAGKGLLVTHNSTIWTHDFPVWLAVRDRSTRTMIGSRTAGQATKYTGRIRRTFERVTPVKADPELLERGMAKDAVSTLITDFGRFKPSNADLWRLDEFILAQDGGVAVDDKEPNFVAYGMDSGFLGGRFDTVIWDDLVDKTNIRTIESRENLINWWESEAETRLDPGGLLILQGQRMSPDDLYRYALNLVDWSEEFEDQPEKAPKKYHHIIYKAHYDDLCEADKNGGVHKGDYPEGCLLDAYRLPWRELARVKKNKLDKYQTIYQQEDVDAEASLIQQAWIDGGMDKDGVQAQGCWDTSRNIGNWPKGITGFSVVTADPSPTKYWAVQWWGYNPETKMQHLIDLARTPMEAPDFLDYNQDTRTYTGLLEEWWVRSNEQGHPFTYLIVEANAAQRFMLQYDHFKRWSAIRNVNLVPHQTNRNKSDEAYGVQTLAPHYKAGRVRFPAGDYLGSKSVIKPMVKELVQWPEGSTDDCVMAHWFLIWNAPYLFDGNDGQVYQFANRPGWIQKNANRFKRGL